MAPTKEEPTPVKREYYALTRSPEELAEILDNIQENLGGETITPRDLQKITVPSQGITKWMVPNPETGKKDALDELEGVIIHVGTPRAYWKAPLEMASRTPPDCSSVDGIVGVSNTQDGPGGACHTCPFNVWGTAKTGSKRGKACKEQRLIYMIRPDDFLPTVVQAPVTSIDQLKQYSLRMSTKTKPKSYSYKKVYTRLTLNEVTSSDFPYSEIFFDMAEPVEDELLPKLEMYTQAITPIVNRSTYEIEPIETRMALEAAGITGSPDRENMVDAESVDAKLEEDFHAQGNNGAVGEAPNVVGQEDGNTSDPVNKGVEDAQENGAENTEGQGQLVIDPGKEPTS